MNDPVSNHQRMHFPCFFRMMKMMVLICEQHGTRCCSLALSQSITFIWLRICDCLDR